MWSIVGEKGPAPWDARVPLGFADDRPLSLPVLLPPFSGHLRADQLQPRPGTQTGSGAVPDLFPSSLQHGQDRKSTRLNSSHSQISYAVFCLKKKKKRKAVIPS